MHFIKDTLRFCHDIGMFAIDRPVSSCTHKTKACNGCYNNKLYSVFGHKMHDKDVKNAIAWGNIDQSQAMAFDKKLKRAHHDASRIRLMTRGEAFSTLSDIGKVECILSACNSRLVWIPTRAWRNENFIFHIVKLANKYKNARIMASIDDFSLADNSDLLSIWLQNGLSTMYFGDDEAKSFYNAGKEYSFVQCKKTFLHLHGHCATCKGGCFSPVQRHIHLKKH